jgi:hypothetical protein
MHLEAELNLCSLLYVFIQRMPFLLKCLKYYIWPPYNKNIHSHNPVQKVIKKKNYIS